MRKPLPTGRLPGPFAVPALWVHPPRPAGPAWQYRIGQAADNNGRADDDGMFYADLHIHSRFSRACSRDCDLEHLAWGARRKRITVVGTGDFTHPGWAGGVRESRVRG